MRNDGVEEEVVSRRWPVALSIDAEVQRQRSTAIKYLLRSRQEIAFGVAPMDMIPQPWVLQCYSSPGATDVSEIPREGGNLIQIHVDFIGQWARKEENFGEDFWRELVRNHHRRICDLRDLLWFFLDKRRCTPLIIEKL
jgi:hypothetical protein